MSYQDRLRARRQGLLADGCPPYVHFSKTTARTLDDAERLALELCTEYPLYQFDLQVKAGRWYIAVSNQDGAELGYLR